MEVVAYKCPNCGAPLSFHSESQKWDCKFCLSSFASKDLENQKPEEEIHKSKDVSAETKQYSCPNCGAEIVTDETTAATFCMFCGSPTILPKQVSEQFRPEGIIPFRLKKQDAEEAYRKLCHNKPLLPRDFKSNSQIEKISGVYVPFWLFDCSVRGDLNVTGKIVTVWDDSNYTYTKTDVYRVERSGAAAFSRVPADGSSKMENSLMDAVEPFDYTALVDFKMPYLSGFYAEKYDEDDAKVYPRVKERVSKTTQNLLMQTVNGYHSVDIKQFQANVQPNNHRYVMMPVWLLVTKYKDKNYTFAMNGQTGKIVGNLPVSYGKMAAIFAGVSVIGALLTQLIGGLLA